MDGAGGSGAGKAEIRARLLAARRARPPEVIESARTAVRNHVMAALTALGGVDVVAAYVPLRTEPGSLALLAELRTSGVRVLVPVTLPDRDLDWTEWPDSDASGLGVGAIGQSRLVLVPALAVARDGTRLGRGGGSYDRALARCAPGTEVTALVFDDEVVEDLPRDPWDVAVPAAITPSGRIPLNRNTGVHFDR